MLKGLVNIKHTLADLVQTTIISWDLDLKAAKLHNKVHKKYDNLTFCVSKKQKICCYFSIPLLVFFKNDSKNLESILLV